MTTAVDDKPVMNFMKLAFAEVCEMASSCGFSFFAESIVLDGAG